MVIARALERTQLKFSWDIWYCPRIITEPQSILRVFISVLPDKCIFLFKKTSY
jgi:hypothetical protein